MPQARAFHAYTTSDFIFTATRTTRVLSWQTPLNTNTTSPSPQPSALCSHIHRFRLLQWSCASSKHGSHFAVGLRGHLMPSPR